MEPQEIENFLDRNGLYDSFTPYEIESDYQRNEGWGAQAKGELNVWLESKEKCAYAWIIWHIGKNEVRRIVTLQHLYGQREEYIKSALEGDFMSMLLVLQADTMIQEIGELRHIGSID